MNPPLRRDAELWWYIILQVPLFPLQWMLLGVLVPTVRLVTPPTAGRSSFAMAQLFDATSWWCPMVLCVSLVIVGGIIVRRMKQPGGYVALWIFACVLCISVFLLLDAMNASSLDTLCVR